MDLTDSIKQYFFDNFGALTPRRQFHFASRLAAWEGSEEAIGKLNGLRPLMVPENPDKMFKELLNMPLGPIYADEVRRQFFHKYPQLHGVNLCLFQLRHLKEIYGVDLRERFLNFISRAELERMARSIVKDREALKFLSSFAVNYLYLLEELYGIPGDNYPSMFHDFYDVYDEFRPEQLNLLVYMFTHCVIADSNFYTRPLPRSRRKIYLDMIKKLDGLIAESPGIKLDGKLEYLVASRICGLVPALQDRINDQLRLSPEGTFIIDPEVKSSSLDINSLNVSEHRNVLLIMSASDFRPHKLT